MTDKIMLENLETNVVGCDVRFFETVESTNEIARRLADEGARDGTVVVAQAQTAGRGRYGRSWFSPPDSIFMTVILRPNEKACVQTVCAIGTVAVCDAILAETQLRAEIKWPNDVVVSGRKVCGVLAEASSCVLLGIGVNVNFPRAKLPAELKETATSLSAETGKKVDRVGLTRKIIRGIDAIYLAWTEGDTGFLEEEWHRMSATLGNQMIVTENGLSYEGCAVDVSITKGLVLELPEGGTRTFHQSSASGAILTI